MSSLQVATYYFPQYHPDSRNEAIHSPGWSEWQIVKHAQPRFPDHLQPHVPLWGYEDESDPTVFFRKIAAAADHGIDCFIFDWYWYEGQPFLHRALEDGYMAAPNRDRLRFALMWANHDWCDLYPAPLEGDYRTIFSGNVTRAIFDDVCNYVIQHYFTNPGYWKIDGCPYFSIYELFRLIDNLGGITATRMALDSFRAKTRAAGFPDLHLNGVLWGLLMAPEDRTVSTAPSVAEALGLQSVTTYSWCHHMDLTLFPTVEYAQVAQEMGQFWAKTAAEYPILYHPTVSMGWDSSPRTDPTLPFVSGHYPYFPVMVGNTPEAFEAALIRAKEFLAVQPEPGRIIVINAWNEWTESSYLEPDTVHGLAYLEAIQKSFRK